MIANPLADVFRHELRRHMGRWPFFCALALMVALTHAMWVDPATGNAMLTVNQTRVLYDSTVMAVMFASNLMVFIGLAGFYLVRGGVREDWTSGMGSILAACPASNASLILGRWLAAIVCLATLSLAALLTVLVIHAFKVDAPIELLVYLRAWFWMSLPCVLFASGMAVLFDACAPFDSRLGDLLYFGGWMGSAFAMDGFWKTAGATWNPLLLTDFAGHYSVLVELVRLFGQTGIGVEHSQFDPQATPLTMPAGFWSLHLTGLRCIAAAIAVVPLWPSVRCFHRYSPDLLKNAGGSRFGSVLSFLRRWDKPMDIVNGLSAPFARALRPALTRAARIPGLAGQVVVECLVTFLLNPIAIPAVLLCWIACLVSDSRSLGAVLLPCLAFWGILICDIGTRDRQAGLEKTGAGFPGGMVRAHGRKLLASLVLGLLICAFVLARWIVEYPTGALALLSGLWMCGAAASLLGRRIGLSRPFLAAFLCSLWMAENLGELPMLDTFGMHGLVTANMIAMQFLAGVFLCLDIVSMRE
ncbi:MAG TPA: hypothetical protein VGH80_08280 [Xanthomonadaceae bacterium]|jgi:hypothetical protein